MRVVELNDCALAAIFHVARHGDVKMTDKARDGMYCNFLAVAEVMEQEKVLGNAVEMILKCQFR